MNEQTKFWQGNFGNDYTARNINLVENNYQMFNKIFTNLWFNDKYAKIFPQNKQAALSYHINLICEFGAGSGQNILALQRIFPDANYYAVEINQEAVKKLEVIEKLRIFNHSIFDGDFGKYDLILSKGLLIHIHPDDIENAFDVLYNASNKYILLCEYYAPTRQEILYRGESDKLWKFDFVKPMLDRGCKILDYGFVSKYDKYFEDDLHWFLFEK